MKLADVVVIDLGRAGWWEVVCVGGGCCRWGRHKDALQEHGEHGIGNNGGLVVESFVGGWGSES